MFHINGHSQLGSTSLARYRKSATCHGNRKPFKYNIVDCRVY